MSINEPVLMMAAGSSGEQGIGKWMYPHLYTEGLYTNGIFFGERLNMNDTNDYLTIKSKNSWNDYTGNSPMGDHSQFMVYQVYNTNNAMYGFAPPGSYNNTATAGAHNLSGNPQFQNSFVVTGYPGGYDDNNGFGSFGVVRFYNNQQEMPVFNPMMSSIAGEGTEYYGDRNFGEVIAAFNTEFAIASENYVHHYRWTNGTSFSFLASTPIGRTEENEAKVLGMDYVNGSLFVQVRVKVVDQNPYRHEVRVYESSTNDFITIQAGMVMDPNIPMPMMNGQTGGDNIAFIYQDDAGNKYSSIFKREVVAEESHWEEHRNFQHPTTGADFGFPEISEFEIIGSIPLDENNFFTIAREKGWSTQPYAATFQFDGTSWNRVYTEMISVPTSDHTNAFNNTFALQMVKDPSDGVYVGLPKFIDNMGSVLFI